LRIFGVGLRQKLPPFGEASLLLVWVQIDVTSAEVL
jgi:hypothetical protein